eukprot:scaffold395378_cov20-Prasinocladus_malaysianus.AAC.1
MSNASITAVEMPGRAWQCYGHGITAVGWQIEHGLVVWGNRASSSLSSSPSLCLVTYFVLKVDLTLLS